jgi:hypothetical protein
MHDQPTRVSGDRWRGKYFGGGTTVAMLLMTDVTGRDFVDLMDDLVIRPPACAIRAFVSRPSDAAIRHRSDGVVHSPATDCSG